MFAPVVLLAFPGIQSEQDDALDLPSNTEIFPRKQFMQFDIDLLDSTELHVPALQGWHMEALCFETNQPAGQAVQDEDGASLFS